MILISYNEELTDFGAYLRLLFVSCLLELSQLMFIYIWICVQVIIFVYGISCNITMCFDMFIYFMQLINRNF